MNTRFKYNNFIYLEQFKPPIRMIIEVKAPSPGESVSEVVISKFNKKSGDFVKFDDSIADIESDKATMELVSPGDGVINWLIKEGDVVDVNVLVATIDTSVSGSVQPAATTNGSSSASTPTTVQNDSKEGYTKGLPSASAQKMIEEKGIDSSAIIATGRDGRITKADVVNTPIATSKVSSVEKSDASTLTVPLVAGIREARREKMSKLRQTLAARLVSVKSETAMLTTFNEVDLLAIKEIRNKYKDKFKEEHNVGLGFMSFFSKACCVALSEFPAVNSSIDGDEMIYYNYVDLGVAVSTERGLMVPVIRNAEAMSLAEIELAIMELATKARNNKISISEMTGGTFTITNGGVFGSLMSTPILNPPQSAILGMHKIEDRPMVIDGKIEIRPMMYVAMSYDHRVIDGKESVSFLVRVKELLEDPIRLLLNV